MWNVCESLFKCYSNVLLIKIKNDLIPGSRSFNPGTTGSKNRPGSRDPGIERPNRFICGQFQYKKSKVKRNCPQVGKWIKLGKLVILDKTSNKNKCQAFFIHFAKKPVKFSVKLGRILVLKAGKKFKWAGYTHM